jgi:enoyl-CoA hydratase
MSPTSGEPRDNGGPRPPEGDWLGTPHLTFRREGPFAIVTLDRPEARNAMTPAMYFGIRYAVSRVNGDADLAGLLITGTGDVFAPGGDLGGGFRSQRPVPGWRAADRHVQ